MWLLLLLERTEGSLPLGRRQINLNINYLLAANNTYNGLDVGGQEKEIAGCKWFCLPSLSISSHPPPEGRTYPI